MKRLFKLGLSALMGVCSLVGISRAQIAVTVDTTASQDASCTLNAETGIWSTLGSDNFGLKLKVLNPEDEKQYRVSFTCKDSEGNDFFDEDTELTSTLTGFDNSQCVNLTSGTYTMVFTLEDRASSADEYAVVEGASTLTIQIHVTTPSLKLTSNPSYTEVDDEISQGWSTAQIKRWVYPSQTAPTFTIAIEDGNIADYYGDDEENAGFSVTVMDGEYNYYYMAEGLQAEDGASTITFTLAPMDMPEEDMSARAAKAARYMPDGDYTMMVVSGDYTFMETYYLRFGIVPTYGLEAVGATTETMEGDEYQKFSTGEAQFAVKAENAPEGWFAEVSAVDDNGPQETRVAKSGDSIVTFTTLSGGQIYYAECTVFNVIGDDTVQKWQNADGWMNLGIPFMVNGEVLSEEPVLTVTPASNGTEGDDDVITFNGVAAFDMSVTARPASDHDSMYKIKAELWTKANYEDYDNGKPITTDWLDVTDTHMEYVDAYDGDYVVVFTLQYKKNDLAEFVTVGDEYEIYFTVTNNEEPLPPVDPTLNVTAGSNGTTGADGKVTFDGPAKFTMAVSGVAEGDALSNYTINAAIYGEDFFTPLATLSYDATDTEAEFLGVYNGEYVVEFYLTRMVISDHGMPEDLQSTITRFTITVTNYAEIELEDPDFTVASASNGTVADNKVTFNGPAAFTMTVGEMTEGDSLKISAELWTKADYEDYDNGKAITTYSYEATDTEAEFLGVYNGEYVVVFSLDRYALLNRDFSSIKDTTIHFTVTGYPEPEVVDPSFAVASASNGTVAEGVVTFDGAAKFTMTVGEMTEGDSLKISAEIWTKAAYEDQDNGKPLTMNSYEATDTEAEFLGVYNGEYVVVFSLDRYSLMMRDFSSVRDTTIRFTVTNYEEIIDNYTVAIKPVGATMTADTAAYAGNVVFDILVGGLQVADSNMTIATTIYTLAQYDTMGDAEPRSTVKAADSVRFDARISDGAYVAVVELKRAGDREEMVVESATLYLTVGGVAVERNTELAGVNVYPNPSNGTFNVAVPEKARIDIFGLNGAKVMSREANAGVESFSINHSGIYFVRVMAGNKAAVKRVVVL